MSAGYNPFPGFLTAETTCTLQNTDTAGLTEGCLAFVVETSSFYVYAETFGPNPPAVDGVAILSTFNGPAAAKADGSACNVQSDLHNPSGTARWILTNLGYGVAADTYRAKYVVAANVPDLDAMPVGNIDLLNVGQRGDVVLLVGQTIGAENGPWVIGTVDPDALTAPLSRPLWWMGGKAIPEGVVIEVGPLGLLFGKTTWKAFNTGLIGVADPQFFPKTQKFQLTLGSGTGRVGAAGSVGNGTLFLHNGADVQLTRRLAVNGLLTVQYQQGFAVYGTPADGAYFGVDAKEQDGTTNAPNDGSTLNVLVTNW